MFHLIKRELAFVAILVSCGGNTDGTGGGGSGGVATGGSAGSSGSGGSSGIAGASGGDLCARCKVEPFITQCTEKLTKAHTGAVEAGCSAEWNQFADCLASSDSFCVTGETLTPAECVQAQAELDACRFPASNCTNILIADGCSLDCDNLDIGCQKDGTQLQCHCEGFGQSKDFTLASCADLAPDVSPCEP